MPVSKKVVRPKPLLVGEANPYGGDPYYALYPAPDRCSGHRLCCLILGMRRADYLREFDRKNLCPHKWNLREAKQHAEQLLDSDRSIVLLGAKVTSAFGMNFTPFNIFGGRLLVLPHPSGLCRMWSVPDAFERARRLVAEVLPTIAHLLGVNSVGGDEPDDNTYSLGDDE
jgi:hypothetical protein